MFLHKAETSDFGAAEPQLQPRGSRVLPPREATGLWSRDPRDPLQPAKQSSEKNKRHDVFKFLTYSFP